MTFTGFSFGAVVALIAASAGALALLQLLRVRHLEVRVVTMLFWAHAIERTRARMLLERFRHVLTYLLLLTIFVLLSLALGRPEPKAASTDRVHEVIVLDAGSDMTARDDHGSRLDAARRAVVEEVAAVGGRGDVAVLVADPTPRLVHRFKDLRALLEIRLNSITAGAVPGERERAVHMARLMLAGLGNPRIVLVTGRSMSSTALQAGSDDNLRIIRVGSPVENAAIVSALFVPDDADPWLGRFIARVAVRGSRPQNVRLLVQRAGGAPLLNASADVPAGGVHDFAIEKIPADGDRLLLSLQGDDAALSDNRAEFRLPLRNRIRVAMDPAAPPALRTGLQSQAAVQLVGPAEASEISVVAAGRPAPAGHAAIVVTAAAPVEAASRAQVNNKHPLLAHLDFEGAAEPFVPAGDRSPILFATAGRTLASFDVSGASPQLELNAALWSPELAVTRRAAFGVFLARAVHHLAGWDAAPIVMSPERSIGDPLWPVRAGLAGERVVMPADRATADLSDQPAAGMDHAQSSRRTWPRAEWFEVLLLLAMAAVVVEAYLHSRGRIS